MSRMSAVPTNVRSYGATGDVVLVLHGGPGVPGYMAPVARGLAGSFRVLEPIQRGSGEVPLTVAVHAEDLRDAARASGARRPALVGSSWGAMLALAYAAAWPDEAGPIVLVGSGTFDVASRLQMKARIEQRRAETGSDDLTRIYSYDPITLDLESLADDPRARRESWDDMLRLQRDGVLPEAFAAIRSPVLMLHGDVDPHPGEMIRDSLKPFLPQLEYRAWKKCGHYPWIEREVRDEFFAVLKAWLAKAMGARRESRRASRAPAG
jgi:pimeloyl-ACP methyl ester carboxylesterase